MLHPTSCTVWVGIDCGSDMYHVAVVDGDGRDLAARTVLHRGDALAELPAWLMTQAGTEPPAIGIALEAPRGPLVELLLERGFRVWAINPVQLDRFRGRYAVSGAKDDRRDARLLATTLRTDRASFRALQVDDPLIIQLREWSRLDAALGIDLRRVANQLRDCLHRFFPQMLELCPAADEPWVWTLLATVPTPAAARRVRPATITRILRDARIRRITAETVVDTLRSAPVTVAPGTVEAVSAHVALLLPRLQLLETQRRTTAAQLTQLLTALSEVPGPPREHHDVTILLSLPGVGVRVAAAMLAEGSEPLQRREYHALRALCGVAPVTKASGHRRVVCMRYACPPRLRTACYHLARTAIQRDAHAHRHYRELRQRGHSHPRALRGVADRQLAVLIAMLKTGELYRSDHPRRLAATA